MNWPSLIALLLVLSIHGAAFGRGGGGGHSSHGYTGYSGSQHVSGYTRRDGTYVSPYTRSAPDGFRSNNLGYSGSGYSASHGSGTGNERATYDDVKSQLHPSPQPTYSGSIARDGNGKILRSQEAKSDFKRQQPCPSTGATSGACPGYVIDHITPLKRGGPDAPSNMQWQTTTEAKAKDRWE